MVTGPACGMVKEKVESLWINGVEGDEASKGDKITFPFATKVTGSDKLYKIIKTGHA